MGIGSRNYLNNQISHKLSATWHLQELIDRLLQERAKPIEWNIPDQFFPPCFLKIVGCPAINSGRGEIGRYQFQPRIVALLKFTNDYSAGGQMVNMARLTTV